MFSSDDPPISEFLQVASRECARQGGKPLMFVFQAGNPARTFYLEVYDGAQAHLELVNQPVIRIN